MKTIDAFKDEIRNAPRIKAKIVENISNQEKIEMVTNLFNLEYDFENEKMSIYYYAEDKEYPKKTLSFRDIEKIIQEI